MFESIVGFTIVLLVLPQRFPDVLIESKEIHVDAIVKLTKPPQLPLDLIPPKLQNNTQIVPQWKETKENISISQSRTTCRDATDKRANWRPTAYQCK